MKRKPSQGHPCQRYRLLSWGWLLSRSKEGMMAKKFLLKLLVVLAALTLIAVACGNDDDERLQSQHAPATEARPATRRPPQNRSPLRRPWTTR